MSVNKAILVGHVGVDPEVRYLDGGTAVANFRLATSENYRNRSGENVTTTEWHNIVAWRHLAELAEKYIRKGRQLYIEGKITTRSWDDKDGNKRYTTEIVANTIEFLGKRSDEDNASAPKASAEKPLENPIDEQPGETQETEDDLPF